MTPMDAPIRLAVDAVGLAPGGGLTYLVNQARELHRRPEQWQPTYFVAPRSRQALVDVVGEDRVRAPFPRPPGYAQRLLWEQLRLPALLEAEGFDLLYAPGNFAVFRSPVPQLVVHHNPNHHAALGELGSLRLWTRMRLERWVSRAGLRRAEAVVYLTGAAASDLGRVGFPPPTAIISSGLPTNWPAPQPLGAELRDCGHCREGGFALGVHHWAPGKRLDWLARAWSSSAGRGQHLVLVGNPLTKAVAVRVRAAMGDPAVAPVVHGLQDVGRETVAELYRRADLYVSASVLEAFPLTPLEAMSFGVPCVLSDIGPHREVAGRAAEYFRPGDEADLAAAVGRARQPGRREELVALGRRRAAEATWAANVEALTRELTAIGRGGRRPVS